MTNSKMVSFIFPYEEVAKHSKLFIREKNTYYSIKKTLEKETNNSFSLAEFPSLLCYIMSFYIKDKKESTEIYKKLKSFGIIKIKNSIYPEISDAQYTMLKYKHLEIPKNILNKHKVN